MTDKQLYTEWCKTQDDMPVFMQPWWLDAVCAGKEWDVMLFRDESASLSDDTAPSAETAETTEIAPTPAAPSSEVQTIVAAMPYLLRKRLWMKYILMPQQTQLGGVWITTDKRDDVELQKRIADEIAENLCNMKLSYYYQQFPINSPLPLLLKERGFRLKSRITYRLEDLQDLDSVMSNFSKNKRRQLQKALTLSVDDNMEAEEFYRFHLSCLKEQGKEISYTREFFLVLYLKASRLSQCRILRIKTANGDTAAAAFLVWDSKSLYYLIPCYSPAFKDSGASALLVWEAIKLARQLSLQFDFEGSMIRGVANHYKQFGSQPFNYYGVRKSFNPLFSLYIRIAERH